MNTNLQHPLMMNTASLSLATNGSTHGPINSQQVISIQQTATLHLQQNSNHNAHHQSIHNLTNNSLQQQMQQVAAVQHLSSSANSHSNPQPNLQINHQSSPPHSMDTSTSRNGGGLHSSTDGHNGLTNGNFVLSCFLIIIILIYVCVCTLYNLYPVNRV